MAVAHILRMFRSGTRTVMVVYGASGEQGELKVDLNTADATGASRRTIAIKYPEAGLVSQVLSANGHDLQVLATSRELANRTWFADTPGGEIIITGPDYVGNVRTTESALRCETEMALGRGGAYRRTDGFLVTPGGEPRRVQMNARPAYRPGDPALAPPVLSAWSVRRGDTEAMPDYFARGWKFSVEPLPMGADGDISAYAWYRATVRAPKAGAYTMQLADAGDWVSAFANGVHCDSTSVKQRFETPAPRELRVTLHKGDNSIALLTAHYGRHKLFNYLGTLDKIDAKGLSGPV
jgi:beta-galactosidase